jgi:SAM-dependent methyltransferase
VDDTDKSSYKVKAEDSLYYSDLVTGLNTTMQLEASLLNKPAIIVRYFDFNPKWHEEKGLPIASDYLELEELIIKYINSQHNLISLNKKSELYKNYGYSNDIEYSPIKNIEKELLALPKKENVSFFADEAIYKMLQDYSFQSVLDIGCGDGHHSSIFKANGKDVTSLDYGDSPYFHLNEEKGECIIGDFMGYDFDTKQYDAIWCSHVLEHQLNANLFLKKIHRILKEDGVLAITVPPLKHEIVGGHLSLWNTGLLLYELVLAGFDCSNAIAKKYGYNISVILEKKTIEVLPELVFDAGDIRTIRKYLPQGINFIEKRLDVTFDGDIENIGWR